MSQEKRTFTYEDAAELIPRVIELTDAAAARVDALEEDEGPEPFQHVLDEWAASIIALGAEVKGLWLVDFDSGAGYYCWRHPEPSLQYYHGYDEGFPGRVRLN